MPAQNSEHSAQSRLTAYQIYLFWLPLALTWLMMSIEGPILGAIMARLPAQEANLAAYGVAFSIGLFIESPIIMILSASTALVVDSESYLKLRNYTYTLNGVLTLLMVLIVLPPIFTPLARDVLQLTPEVRRLAHIGTILLIPWPGAIGFRRFYQGVLIREGYPRRVTWGTVIRLLTMFGSAVLVWQGFHAEGIVVGTVALSVGVSAEAIASRFMVRRSIARLRIVERRPERDPLTYRTITQFYAPLALTSIIGLGAQPVVTLFLSRSIMPLESLAVWPVLTGFVFLFRGVGMAYQEVMIALTGEGLHNYRPLFRFGIGLAVVTTVLISIVAFTPLSSVWFEWIVDLKPRLAEFAILPLQIMILLPGATAILAMQRGMLVSTGKTRAITIATAIEVVMIIVLLAVLIEIGSMVGAVAAAIAAVTGRLVANGYITFPYRRALARSDA